MRGFRLYATAAAGLALVLVLVSGTVSASAQTAPLSKARLQGNYDVVTRIASVKGIDASVGDKDEFVWGFRPYASSGPSDVRLVFRYQGASFDTHRLTMRLERAGVAYTGTATATFLECFFKDVPGPLTVSLRVTKAVRVNGSWRATHFKGTYVHTTSSATSSIYTCPATRLTVSFWGSPPAS